MSEPTIHKAFFQHNFTCLYNVSAEDELLSFQAKGLLWYMLSRPDNWKIHRKHLATVYKGDRKDNGIDAINRMCDELIERGYMVYTKKDPDTGKMIHRYDIYPVPHSKFKEMFPKRDIPCMDIPCMDDPTPITRKESITRKKITTEELAAPVEVSSEKEIKLQKKQALEELGVLTDGQVMSLMNRTLEDILKACECFKLEKSVDTPERWLSACIKGKWWLNVDQEKLSERSLFDTFKSCLIQMIHEHGEKLELTFEGDYIHLNINGGGVELTKSNFSDNKLVSNILTALNNSFQSKFKIVHVILPGKNTMEVMR